ncbi:MAG: protein kinase domain-containing protein, partial [Nannocystaceae bacterium]
MFVGHSAEEPGRIGAASRADEVRPLAFKSVEPSRVRSVATSMVLLRGIACASMAMPRTLARGADGGWWMVSEYVEGTPLVPGPEDPLTACREACAVAQALSLIHDCGTHHGDVSAGNVVRGDGDQIWLLDFGSLGQRGTGTPGFLAPEVLAGDGGPAADWFGLGALLCLRLSGEVPWRRPEDVASYSVDDARARVEDLQQRAEMPWPRGLSTLLVDLIDPRAEVRRAVGPQVARRLQRLLDGASTGDGPVAPWVVPAHIPWLGGSLAAPLEVLGRSARGTILAVAGPPGSGRGRAVRELALQHKGATMAEVQWLPRAIPSSSAEVSVEIEHARRAWLRERAPHDALVVTCFEACGEGDAGAVAQAMVDAAPLAHGALVVVASPALGEALSRLEGTEVRVHNLMPVEKTETARLISQVKVGARDAAAWAEVLMDTTGGWAGDLVTTLMRAAALEIHSPRDPRVREVSGAAHPPISRERAREILGVEWGDPSARVPSHWCEG